MPGLATFQQLPTRSKVIVGATAVGLLLLVFFMLRLATAPSYTTLQSGLDPAQTGKMTAALDEQGIPYELQANGTALAVQKADTAKARIALATTGASAGGDAPGFELFDNQKLGASDFQQKVTYQRALEGEIAKTVNAVQGVSDAQVQLVMPEEDLFVDEASPATAAVSLGNPGDTLEAGAVKGIAQLVSSSVKGLKPSAVTITDAGGQLLWPAGDGTSGAGGGASSMKQAAEERYARGLEASLNAMLTRTLGPDKALVQVQADLNMDKTTRNELVHAKRGVPTKTSEETETLEGSAVRAGGAAGTGGNIPTYSGGAGGAGGDSNYEREANTEERVIDKTVSKTDVAQGAINRLNVALVLDKSVTGTAAGRAAQQQIQQIEDSVATAAGVDTQRGDTITATQLAFAKPPAEAKESPVPAGLLAQAKWIALALGALIFCFFMMRHLRKREREALPQPEWLSQIDRPVSLAALEAGDDRTREMVTLPEREVEPGLLRLEQLMDREPERVAAQVRQWMTEE